MAYWNMGGLLPSIKFPTKRRQSAEEKLCLRIPRNQLAFSQHWLVHWSSRESQSWLQVIKTPRRPVYSCKLGHKTSTVSMQEQHEFHRQRLVEIDQACLFASFKSKDMSITGLSVNALEVWVESQCNCTSLTSASVSCERPASASHVIRASVHGRQFPVKNKSNVSASTVSELSYPWQRKQQNVQ